LIFSPRSELVTARFDAVLFDLDGTLAETHWDIAASTNFVLASFGRPSVGPDAIPEYLGLGLDHLIAKAMGESADAAMLAEARRRYVEHHAVHCCDRVRLYDGIAALLSEISASGVVIGMLSNKPAVFCERILVATGIRACFAAVFGADSTPWKKPDGRGLRALASELKSAHPFYIGDSSIDIAAARDAGIPVGLVTWGYGRVEGEEPDFRWANVDEMTKDLVRLSQGRSTGDLGSNPQSAIRNPQS
jgi:phosphoglycolate phosphatase